MPSPFASQSLEDLSKHPRGLELARFARDVLFSTIASPSADLGEAVRAKAAERGLSQNETELPQGNVLAALQAPLIGTENLEWLGVLLVLGIADNPTSSFDEVENLTGILVRVEARYGIETLAALDTVLKSRAGDYWKALATLIVEHERQAPSRLSRGEAVVAACALASSIHPDAQTSVVELRNSLRSRVLVGIMGERTLPVPEAETLHGELVSPPRATWTTFLFGITGWLAILHVARWFARYALQLRRPAQVSLSPQGLRVRVSTHLLGKVVREQESVIPYHGLTSAVREVRYPRLGTYAGLLALVIGSFIGVSTMIDGLRAGSLSLTLIGPAILLFGIAADFALMSLLPGAKGTCRLVLQARKGKASCVNWVNTEKADALLRAIPTAGAATPN